VFYGSLFGIPLPFYNVVAAYSAAFVFLNLSPLGWKVYSVGGNATAARLSGINVPRIQCLVFIMAGIASAPRAILFLPLRIP
jgi:ribose transport system permease protein